jgi:hypothetical protein
MKSNLNCFGLLPGGLLRPLAAACWLAGWAIFIEAAAAAPTQPGAADLSFVKGALAQVETGAAQEGRCAADRVRGQCREVSRYQILPRLWHEQTSLTDYSNPSLAWQVAQAILAERIRWFSARAGRAPSFFDLYVTWNAPLHYQQVGFRPSRVRPAIADRARRFANLVEDAQRSRPGEINPKPKPVVLALGE